MMNLLFGSLLFLQHALSASADVLSGRKNCTCGFVDNQTNTFFTDSIVVYFNETKSLPTDFIAENYVHSYEKDWNAIYRQGADPGNVRFNDSGSLQLYVQPPTDDHVVQGGGIRTTRRDIQHGSFRTLIRSPPQAFSGSAMSMMLQYNESETTELSVMNQNNHSDGWVGTFVNDEFTTHDLGINYTQLLELPASNRNYTTLGGGLNNGSIDPWSYTEYRIDWTKDIINFYIGGNLTRQVLHKDNEGMPSVPSAFLLKHWSTGNRYSMRGPPRRESDANVGWVRLFFNSSSMTPQSREDFDARCPLTEACSMDDETLRGSTPYTDEATSKWKQNTHKRMRRMPALWVSIASLAFSTFLVVHALIRRLRQPKSPGHRAPVSSSTPAVHDTAIDSSNNSFKEKNPFESKEYMIDSSKTSLNENPFAGRPPSSKYDSVDDLAIERMEPSPSASELGGSTPYGPSRQNSVRFASGATTPCVPSLYGSRFNNTREELYSPEDSTFRFPTVPGYPSELTLNGASNIPGLEDKIRMETVTESALPAPRMCPQPAPQRQRIDHLAGLTALCALFVTIMHFGLTFVPAIVIPGAPQHARSEYWAQKIIAPFILNQMWLGVFFATSVRFLTAPFLRKGNVEEIAKAAVRRTPRLMIPVASIALLEYFLIDIGATKYLEYIPSLTWSTWPYVTRYNNFGQYISEVLELVFLIPNAVPQITLHYCTGVLWTIAVQLQGSWLVLLGAIVVREIKTPWKRMCFYTFCLINHWYANSWGTYLWFGLLLTDLDVTFSCKKYLDARPLAYYPVITVCWLCVAAGFAVNIIPNWTDTTFNFATAEHNLHSDPSTGEPMLNTDSAGYPAYYTPRLNGLLFAGGMQAVVELSAAVQWLLSTPPLLILFPHIFTIYLLHGLVFWTWGSWLLVFLSDRGFSYNIAVAVVGVTSYAVLALCLPIVTPILEALGKDITALVWMTAREKSPLRRGTLFPFPQDLFTGREVNMEGKDGAEVDVEAGKGQKQLGQREE
ncbi:hypothetical protein EK21DRAFT_87759 [Setomelanomma holmii]|uniref:GH16 domain-containing protein n=1 Tax=Setomelanomma holmii TaxID=210430 RepID=A0A9P4HCU4_9PLEO|nr:hypothetical protein EK21DRAFT_87759 [Setomelanomma holmii]